MEQIIQKARDGDMEAFAEIVKVYQNRIYNLALKMLKGSEDAQDATQDIFLKIYTNLRDYREESQFSTWVYRISLNTCLDKLRQKKRERKQFNSKPMDEMKEISIGEEVRALEEIIETNELKRAMIHAIEELPAKYQTVLLLYHQQECSYQEIADILDIPIQTVGTQLYRAKGLLRKKLLQERRD